MKKCSHLTEKEILGTLCAISLIFSAGANGIEAETIYTNGHIITMDDSRKTVEAVAVSQGKIQAVGELSEMKSLASEHTNIVDLEGKTMLPGFIDPHGHFFFMAEYAYGWVDINSKPIGTVETMDDMMLLLKQQVEVTPEGEWILGWGYDDTNIKEMRHPTREDLDNVSTKHPIYVQHVSGWLSSANTLALELAGINKDTPDPDDGHIQKDPKTGEPTGVIESALPPVYKVVPSYKPQDYVQAMEAGSDMYLAAGVTTAHEGWGNFNQWELLQQGLEAGTLKVRTIFRPLAQGSGTEELELYPQIASGTAIDQEQMLVLGAHKLTADGSIQGYTAYLSDPYFKQPEGQVDHAGYPTHDHEALQEMVLSLHKKGHQLAIHGNGDKAIDYILDAFEAAQKAYPREDTRHIVIHSQMARDDQLDRMKTLGAIPSFFSTHTYFWGDRHYEIFMGAERAERMSPAGSAVRKGLPFTLHNDTYITPISPLKSIWSAVNRQSSSGRDLGKEAQGVSVYDAMKGVTIYAAWQSFEDDIKGSIEAGKLADFIILDENPLKVDPMAIKDIRIRATIIGDDIVYGAI
ncbi:amidohydrolase [Photobacterium minamisatsumaniensis]|uniref:amidohydrolase n=1 Tax=Photobacterium minamisatsumaniensis TaxID=2910233 RepID=UPI003D0F12ED